VKTGETDETGRWTGGWWGSEFRCADERIMGSVGDADRMVQTQTVTMLSFFIGYDHIFVVVFLYKEVVCIT